MRLLFVKDSLAWPRSAGHDVHGYFMMRALERLGHEVALLTAQAVTAAARGDLDLPFCWTFNEVLSNNPPLPPLQLSRLQERFRSYWGIEPPVIQAVGQVAAEWQADAVVAVGLNVLPYLGAVERALRVWYAADEWAWHHLSQLRVGQKRTWGNLKQATLKGLYERAYAALLDRVWVVSEGDRRAMRWVAGVRAIDVLPNGVDGAHYHPQEAPPLPRSCTFWGRLDFGPNVQALEWFCQRVWPEVLRGAPDARFTIYGFSPGAAVNRLAALPGVCVVPDVPDLRAGVAAHQVAVLPFVSGGGIKNKLLEAAGMGKAILCTPRACGGLRGQEPLPFLRAQTPRDWVDALNLLWMSPERCQRLGADARNWVQTYHTWERAASDAIRGIESSACRSPIAPVTDDCADKVTNRLPSPRYSAGDEGRTRHQC